MEEMKLNLESEQEINVAEEIERRIREGFESLRAEWEEREARASAMTGEERAAYELSQRENELAERERRLRERELRTVALEKLAQRGLPGELADALPYDSEDACMAGLDAVEDAFRRAVQTAVDERLRGRAPAGDVRRAMSAEALTDSEYYSLGAGKLL